ncbi:hypothetical protein H310_13944 [Aphanomyces invadans]|uniref:Uncharacterized protein n=1 Tax=Aphanomyces invadans TaxID=157072 RepID=A0A024TC38_9STRA|nr:hypothetical protein H310_13944 [Aphanomyces invadans]ETV91564.1 hypothetical protein H310_13944 [Aphanomyces invadans]|eukprot:XP_008879832.1 hypothetical protein H310_13944 [Aphanomyces invadans]
MSHGSAGGAPAPPRLSLGSPATELHPSNFVVVKTVSRNSYHHPTIQENDERVRSGLNSNISAFNFSADCADTIEHLSRHNEEDFAAAVLASGDKLVYGDMIELYGTAKGATWNDVPVGLRPLADTGFVNPPSEDQVVSLLASTSSALVHPARFVVLPPHGDPTVVLGTTTVHLGKPFVLAPVLSSTNAPSPSRPVVALNNKLPHGVSDLIGVRPRTHSTSNGGTTKGELHLAFIRSDRAAASLGSTSPSSVNEKGRLSPRLTTAPLTLRILSANRVRKTYDGQDIGHCHATGVLVCGHKKTMFGFAPKLHHAPLTFRLAKVSTER